MYVPVERMWQSCKLFGELLIINPCLKTWHGVFMLQTVSELPRSWSEGCEGPSSAAPAGGGVVSRYSPMIRSLQRR